MQSKALATVKHFLKEKETALQKSSPNSLNLERFKSYAVMAIAENENLQRCSPASLMKAICTSAYLGLEVNSPLQLAHLVPYGQTCQFLIDWRGLVHLAKNKGNVLKVYAYPVYEKDSFEMTLGLDPDIKHAPALGERGEFIGVYAVCKLQDKEFDFEYMSKEQIEKIRKAAKSKNVWADHFEEMARKTVIKRLMKRQSLSADMAAAITVDNQAEAGKAQADLIEVKNLYEDQVAKETPAPTTEPPKVEDAPEAPKKKRGRPRKVSTPEPEAVPEAPVEAEAAPEQDLSQYPDIVKRFVSEGVALERVRSFFLENGIIRKPEGLQKLPLTVQQQIETEFSTWLDGLKGA